MKAVYRSSGPLKRRSWQWNGVSEISLGGEEECKLEKTWFSGIFRGIIVVGEVEKDNVETEVNGWKWKIFHEI